MEQQKSIVYITILLAMTAGYCDTATFVSASKVFSAHVTGNFILFAYDIIKYADISNWLKLLSFPIFIAAVITSGGVAARSPNPCAILIIEGVILTISGIAWIIVSLAGIASWEWVSLSIAMCVVFSMGLQNAFGKLYSKETFGPTTMMTGNVTQAALDIGKLLKGGVAELVTKSSLQRQVIILSGFLLGCILGAVVGKMLGLASVIFPGVAVTAYALRKLRQPTLFQGTK